MPLLAELSTEQAAVLLGSALFVSVYARRAIQIRKWRRIQANRCERAARKVVTLDFLDEAALDGLAGDLLIADPPERLRRIEVEDLTTDERAGSVTMPLTPQALLSRRRGRQRRELYRGMAEPCARVDAVLTELAGPRPWSDRIIVSNEQLVTAVHDAAAGRQRVIDMRLGARTPSPARIGDRDGAVALTAAQALRDCSLLWLRGEFSIEQDGEARTMRSVITADLAPLRGLGFPVGTRVRTDQLTRYGSRLLPGLTVPLELLGTASHFTESPACLSIAPFAIFTRSSLHLPREPPQLPVALAALPQPLRSLSIELWCLFLRSDPDLQDLDPELAARRALRGRGTPPWGLRR